MALKPPPFNDKTLENDGSFTQTWRAWLGSLKRESETGFSGTFDIANGDTVTVVNGKITDVS